MSVNLLNQSLHNAKDDEVAITCSPILTYIEIVDTLVDVSKTRSYHYDLIPDTAIIPIGGNYSNPN